MDRSLDGDDLTRAQRLRGDTTAYPRQPPVGKTWIKQIFAGQMGVALLAALFGMKVGAPLKFHRLHGMQALHRDAASSTLICRSRTPTLSPSLTPVALGQWSRFNVAKGGSAAQTVRLS